MAIKDDMEDVQEAVINELITENGITNTLADNQVTETKILNGAVTAAKLGSDVNLTVADGAVTPAKLSQAYLPLTGGSVTGRVMVGTTTEGLADGDDLTISGSGNVGMTIRSTNSGQNNLYFSDATPAASQRQMQAQKQCVGEPKCK